MNVLQSSIMENSEVFDDIERNSSNFEADNDSIDQEFYSPLSLTGYLTPLQRKKLREKRDLSFYNLDTRNSKEIKKSRGIKRKKEHSINTCRKTNGRIKKSKENISQVKCMAAKIILKVTNTNMKDKKFFKSSPSNRLEKASFRVPLVLKRNLFSNIDKCVKENLCSLKKKSAPKERSSNMAETFDSVKDVKCLSVDTPYLIHIEKNSENTITLQNRISGIEVSENFNEKEKSLFDFDWPSDEVLLERQEKARADLKKQKVSKTCDVEMKDTDNEQQNKQVKFFPIFYATFKKQSKSLQDTKRKQKNGSKKMKESLSGGKQMIIDAGQKEIGAKLCSTCNMIYSVGEEDDERLHSSYHNMYQTNLKFPGWKEENMIGEYRDGRVLMVKKNDQSFKIKKIEDIMVIANRDLGFSSSAIPSKPDLTFILFISNEKQVAGCVIAEPISSAYPVLLANSESSSDSPPNDQKEKIWRIGDWYSSSESFPAVCGINRIWVAHDYRRRKVASRMIDCLRCHFIHGHVIGIRELAFTDPSLIGREFAAAYTGTDNFLVYR